MAIERVPITLSRDSGEDIAGLLDKAASFDVNVMDRMPIIHRNPILVYGYIYMTTCQISGKHYIGQRKWNHPYKYDSYLGSGKALKNAIRKYGRGCFTKEILDWAVSYDELSELEKYWISYYDAVESDLFYNIQSGGGSWAEGQVAGERNPFYGHHHTQESITLAKQHKPDQRGANNPNYGHKWNPEQRKAAYDRLIGKYCGNLNPNYGHKWNDTQRRRASVIHSGTPVSNSTKQKISKSLIEYYQEHPEAHKANPWTQEQRIKSSLSHMGSRNSMYGHGERVSGSKNGMYGKTHTKATKAKMRANHADVSGRNNPTYGSKHTLS